MAGGKRDKRSFWSFWTTLPGILTGAAALIGSVTALITALVAAGIIVTDGDNGPTPTPPATASATATIPPTPQPSPTPDSIEELSFLERVAGHYTLSSWTEANRPISIGAQITDGSLDIDDLGTADWSVAVEQTYSADPGRVEMTARGKIQLGLEPRILGVKGGRFNNTTYLDDKWGQVGTEVELAVRGWASGSGDDPFTISLDTQTDGPHILQMRNSRGTYTWVKQ